RLEHLRGSALGFRNLTNYIARSLLETGGFRPDYTLDSDEPNNLVRLTERARLAPDRTSPDRSNDHQCTSEPRGKFRKQSP
ncbi:hypothetical protein, partial [Propioniciclava flava]|uniref:hypothetical protein n=1 Tax=Propioniciclava flava TaxID=2072026 RepID=UPI0019D5649A